MAERALVVAGHGSHRNPDSSAPAHAHAEAIRDRGEFDEVRVAFWKEEPAFADVLHTVDADEVFVVPLFVSEGYFTDRVVPRELGLRDSDRPEGKTVHYTPPVGTHESIRDVVVGRVDAVIREGDAEIGDGGELGLAVVGHGTERNPNSARAIYDHADALRERDAFDEVHALFMDEPPYVDEVTDRFDVDDVAVVPIFIADGFHTRDEIPELLGLVDDPGDPYPVPGTVDGHRLWYTGAVGTSPSMADVVLERARDAGADPRAPDGDAADSLAATAPARAFRRWLDPVEGETATPPADATRTWGELAVTTRVAADGARTHAVRHHDDRRADPTALDSIGFADLPALVTYDADGRYRPFRGATTLRDGWVLDGLDGSGVVRAVATVYPAAIEHWAREREGRLDVTHFRETAARQTGIYDVVSELDGDDLRATVEACCGACAKRRAWEEDDANDVPADDESTDEIPCRAPCSFFVAAAREIVADEQPHDRPDADPSADPGDLTNPANPYRVRYRRALGHTLEQ